MNWTKTEQQAGATVIRNWPKSEIMFVVNLPRPQRELIVLTAALLNIAPGAPTDPQHVLEIP